MATLFKGVTGFPRQPSFWGPPFVKFRGCDINLDDPIGFFQNQRQIAAENHSFGGRNIIGANQTSMTLGSKC